MRKYVFLILCLGFGTIQAQKNLLLEVFTYDGCSHCMLANRALRKLEVDSTINRKVVVLTHHVDYEKDDGFQDSLDHPFSRMRQKELVQKGICSGIFTPQAVLDGKICFPISGRKQLVEKINSFVIDTAEIDAVFAFKSINEGFSVEINFNNPLDSNWQINLILIENSRIVSPKSGDNAGATLEHANCLLEARRFNYRDRFSEIFRLPKFILSQPEKFAVLVYLQHTKSGFIQALKRMPLNDLH